MGRTWQDNKSTTPATWADRAIGVGTVAMIGGLLAVTVTTTPADPATVERPATVEVERITDERVGLWRTDHGQTYSDAYPCHVERVHEDGRVTCEVD